MNFTRLITTGGQKVYGTPNFNTLILSGFHNKLSSVNNLKSKEIIHAFSERKLGKTDLPRISISYV